MSQATELLNTLYEDEIATYSVGSDSEPHIVVNPDRTVTVPEELTHIAVQFDHNVETVTFDCPRYWDEHDFSSMHVYINYMRPDGYKDQYPVKNLRVDDTDSSMIHFDWTISKNATLVKGNLVFLVCIKLDTFDDEPHWNSRLNRDLIVDEGMECYEDVIESDPDAIEAILTRLDQLETNGGVTDEQISTAVNAYLAENPVESGATAEQVAQLEANTQAIEELQNSSGATEAQAAQIEANKTAIAELKSNPVITSEQIAQIETNKSDIEQLRSNPVITTEQISQIETNKTAIEDLQNNSGVTDERITQVVTDYLTENPVQSGATAEQAAQIEANTQAIEELKSNPVITTEQIAQIETNKSDIEQLRSNPVQSGGFIAQDTAPEDTALLWVDTSDNTVDDTGTILVDEVTGSKYILKVRNGELITEAI